MHLKKRPPTNQNEKEEPAMLTPAQEALIAATAPTVAEHLDAITRRFYPLMFERYPEVKPLFNEAHPEQLHAVTIHERGDAADHIGRVDRELLARLLPEDARCYFVGPQGFMTAVNHALTELGVPAERRHHEHFGPSRPLDAA
jgi:NAD(P)H-flavin reductase